MEIEWLLDGDGDWILYVGGEYEGLLCNRFTPDKTWRFVCPFEYELGVLDAEEAKAKAFALWAFNK